MADKILLRKDSCEIIHYELLDETSWVETEPELYCACIECCKVRKHVGL